MKRLPPATAALGVVGTIGIAAAQPIVSASVTIWSADTPAPHNVAADPAQQGLPTATGAFAPPGQFLYL